MEDSLFINRLDEINEALDSRQLLEETGRLEINPRAIETDDPIILHSCQKTNASGIHTLTTFVFQDGEISIAYLFRPKDDPGQLAFIGLITAEDGDTWSVAMSKSFEEFCSEQQCHIWRKFPERFDEEEGIFDQEDGPKALALIVEEFANIPDSSADPAP